MKEFLIAILILTFLLVVAMFLNDYMVKRKFRHFIKKKYKAIQGLAQKLEAKQLLTADEVRELVERPGLRQAVYQVLATYNRQDLFPTEYATIEKGAESYLVTWLEFPTELGRAPDEIKTLTKILLDDGVSTYYVFKYRSEQPRWAAKLNWMIGAAGPYYPDSSSYDVPKRIFSRFNTVGTISPEEEVKWMHENVNQH